MGFGGISIWQLLIILVIIVLLFGTKRLRNIGTDLGSAIRGFRSSIQDKDANSDAEDATFSAEPRRDAVTVQPNVTTTPAASTQATATHDAKPTAAAQSPVSGQDKN